MEHLAWCRVLRRDTTTMSASRAELIAKIQEEVTFTSDAKLHDQYDDTLRECYDPMVIGCCRFTADQVLKNCDEVVYRTGFNDWLDGQDFIEIDGENYPKDEVEDFLGGLKDELWSAIEEVRDSGEETDMSDEEAELEEIKKFCKEHGI